MSWQKEEDRRASSGGVHQRDEQLDWAGSHGRVGFVHRLPWRAIPDWDDRVRHAYRTGLVLYGVTERDASQIRARPLWRMGAGRADHSSDEGVCVSLGLAARIVGTGWGIADF